MHKWVKLIYNNLCQPILGNLKAYRCSPIKLARSCTSRICLRKVLLNDAPKVIKIVQDNFCKCEPLVKGLEMSEKYSPALIEFWRNSIDQGMSYVALSNNLVKTENSLGVIVNTKLLQWEPDYWWKFARCIKCTKTRNLISLYSFLIKETKLHKRFNINRIFNIAHIIYNDESNKECNSKLDFINLSTLLADRTLKIAQYEGYKLASLICTGHSLAKVAENLKMDQICEYPYKKLITNKLELLVKPIEPNVNVKVYIKKLESIL